MALVGATLVVPIGAAQAQDTLRGAADAQGLRMGAAVANGPLSSDAQYRNILGTEFNSVTAENSMKWESLQPSQGQFTFSQGDAIVDFAQANNQAVYGHTLVWHNQTPSWVQNLSGQQLDDAMQTHITTVLDHYEGQVEAWDVANEVIDDGANLRNSFWLQGLGEGYIADAFRYADAADPNAKLYINDYNIDGINAKSNAYYDLVSGLLNQGVPIDGIGLQAHMILGQVPSSLEDNIRRFAQLGLEVRITELDIRMDLPVTQAKLEQQRQDYAAVVDACMSVDGCVGVTTWGFTDAHSWVPDQFGGQGAALPFDENYNKKPAYYGILDTLDGGTPNDTTPPTQPGAPQISDVTSNSASLTWSASSDSGGSGLAGYSVYREQSGNDQLLASPSTNSVTLTGLDPQTQYSVYVVARDGAGNTSSPSTAASFTTQEGPGGGGACDVEYTANNWGGSEGFTASVTITNTGSSQLNGWTLGFTFPGDQSVREGWSATWSQSGADVTAESIGWNDALAPGGSTTVGFNGTYSGSNPEPTEFTLNGEPCSVS
ncbi:endo-1,4-beta-xylanase [Phytoactinopolyspora halotolerans]